jgi:hypothetical protein
MFRQILIEMLISRGNPKAIQILFSQKLAQLLQTGSNIQAGQGLEHGRGVKLNGQAIAILNKVGPPPLPAFSGRPFQIAAR